MVDLGSVQDVPVWHPPLAVLELAELVISGMLAAPPSAVTPPQELAGEPVLVLEDAEGTPVARLDRSGGSWRFAGLRPFTHGPARTARRTPAEVLAELGERPLVVPVERALTVDEVEEAVAAARSRGRALLWLGVIGSGRRAGLPPAALARALRTLAAEGDGVTATAALVAVPLLLPTPGPATAATQATQEGAAAGSGGGTGGGGAEGAAGESGGRAEGADEGFVRAVAAAYGDVLEVGRGEEGGPREGAHVVPAAFEGSSGRRGVTVFFTGLSGSGKSTVAKALADRIEAHGARTVSLLDGDEVRRLLSAGLTFSRADRDLNIRRIGFVATEVTRHGGLAVCAPIAPFEQARDQVRAAVEDVGDFILVHVSTPLEECERRDRKGLYAKARQGLIPDFTGISSPYEAPVRADLRIDTTDLPVAEAVAMVWSLLEARGHLAPEAEKG